MVEGARLESVFRGNSNVGSNPTLSAIMLSAFALEPPGWFSATLFGSPFSQLFGIAEVFGAAGLLLVAE